MSKFLIGDREISNIQPCLVVAEVAQAHDGSLGAAHSFVDAVASAGADAIKFQTHIAAAESTLTEPWRVRFSAQDRSRYEYWKRMEFSEEQWRGLKTHAENRGLLFMSSPFSIEAAELLERVGVLVWKVASGELGNLPLLDRLARTGLPVVLSSGMSGWGELDVAVRLLQRASVPVTVLQCTSAYPTPPEKIGLNMLDVLARRYECPVGLSDHSGTIYPGLAAAALGISVLEVHVVLTSEMFGPDVMSSVTTSELRQLLEGIRFIEQVVAHPVDKDHIAHELAPLRAVFNKTLVSRRALPVGAVLTAEDLVLKKAGGGLAFNHADRLVGRRLKRALAVDQPVGLTDLEEIP